VFENSVLRSIFGPKRDKVTGEWRKLHNGELHIFYSSPNIIRQIKSRRVGWVDMWHAWERTEKCTRFGGKARRKETLGRPRRRWEDGIRKDLREISWRMWIGLDWLRIGTGGVMLSVR
jgi:hypothetical protein